MGKRITISLTICLLAFNTLFAQSGIGYKKEYHFLHSENITADKNFYLLTVIGQSPNVKEILTKNAALQNILQQKLELIGRHVNDTNQDIISLLADFKWSTEDTLKLNTIIRSLYAAYQERFDAMIDRHLRPSGYYQLYTKSSNIELFLFAWRKCFSGINYIIDQYGLGKKMRYSYIDSASYDVHSEYYNDLFKITLSYLDEKKEEMTVFYMPSFFIAVELLSFNDRDEPARYEPLETGENKKAIQKIKRVKWNNYKYAAIMIPGEGPELPSTPLAPSGKMRCDLAVERYKKGLAPFIIVSGGHVHPFHTQYCEAIEMKKYLMKTLHIPEESIIVEPYARHTTTNFRNAERLMMRYGFPLDKPSLCVTTKDQADYIEDQNFDKRNIRELGFLPYHDKKQVSNHEIIFYSVIESLTMDSNDPLDP
jgi:hypothetical protein